MNRSSETRAPNAPESPPRQEPSLEERVQEGIRALDVRNFAEAGRLFKRVLSEAPFRTDVKELLALALDERTYEKDELHAEQFEPSRARQETLSALKGVKHRERRTVLSRWAKPILIGMAIVGVGLGAWVFLAGRLSSGGRGESHAPESADVLKAIARAQVLSEDKRYDDAIVTLENALRLKPSDPEAIRVLQGEYHYRQAMVLRQKSDYPGAIKDLQEATLLHPSKAEYFSELGWLCHLHGRNLKTVQRSPESKSFEEKASAAFQAALALNPDYVFALHGLAKTRLALDDPQGAAAPLRRIMTVAPKSREASDAAEALREHGLPLEAPAASQQSQEGAGSQLPKGD